MTHMSLRLKSIAASLLACAFAMPVLAEVPSVAGWQGILDTYLKEDANGANLFDYGALQANAEDQQKLTDYIASHADIELSDLTEDEVIAMWSNIYNAVTIQHIVERYPVKSIRSGYIVGPWKEVKVTVGGQDISLHNIENKVLRGTGDPLIHYSINCASFSCPDLLGTAWRAETLDVDLDRAARAYVNDARGVRVTDRGLVISRIYKWYKDDFGGSNTSVVEHLKKFADDDLKAAIEANPEIRKHAYDWNLNDAK